MKVSFFLFSIITGLQSLESVIAPEDKGSIHVMFAFVEMLTRKLEPLTNGNCFFSRKYHMKICSNQYLEV